MELKVSTVIEKSVDDCVSLFIDFDEVGAWHPKVKSLVLKEGVLLTHGSKYQINDGDKMLTIENILLPYKVSLRVDQNPFVCEHKFRGHDDHTHYYITAIFDGNLIQKIGFMFQKKKVLQLMNAVMEGFKTYIEKQ